MNQQARADSLHGQLRAVEARVKELEAARDTEWRQFVRLTHDEQIAELERRWKEAEARAARLEAIRDAFSEQIEQHVSELVAGRIEELQAENMQLRRVLARLEAASSAWLAHNYSSNYYDPGWRDKLRELSEAITEAAALQASAEIGE